MWRQVLRTQKLAADSRWVWGFCATVGPLQGWFWCGCWLEVLFQWVGFLNFWGEGAVEPLLKSQKTNCEFGSPKVPSQSKNIENKAKTTKTKLVLS